MFNCGNLMGKMHNPNCRRDQPHLVKALNLNIVAKAPRCKK